MIGVGIPATETTRGISRKATLAEIQSGVVGANGPAFVDPVNHKKWWDDQFKAIFDKIAEMADKTRFIHMLPYRYNQLPKGWYFANGDRYANTTDAGKALNALSTNFKSDWKITNNGTTTNVPNLFHTDGRGFVIRSVNGVARAVGSVEIDAMQNITGNIYSGLNVFNSAAGAFYLSGSNNYSRNPDSSSGYNQVEFDASRVARTASETRMLNIGMTPAIFLGV